MKLSVVVPIGDASTPAHLLEALTTQTVPAADMDVLVVDAYSRASEDSTVRDAVARVAPALSVRLFERHGGRRSAAVNLGVREAAMPLVLVLAPDFVATPGLVEAHLALHHARPEPSVCGLGPAIFEPGSVVTPLMRWLEESGQLFGVSFTRPDPAALRRFWYGVNVSFRRELFERAGGFDESFPYAAVDDYEFSRRLFAAGMDVVYLPAALAYHEHFISMDERLRSMRRAGESLHIYERIHPGAYWWQRAARRPDLAYFAVEHLTWLRSMITRRESDQWSYFAWAMERQLARGYRDARARGGRPPAPRA
jgi:GT2 family glycosyltransferase